LLPKAQTSKFFELIKYIGQNQPSSIFDVFYQSVKIKIMYFINLPRFLMYFIKYIGQNQNHVFYQPSSIFGQNQNQMP